MTSAKGSFDFLSREFVEGIAFNVERMYLGGQLASGEGVTLDCTDDQQGQRRNDECRGASERHIHLEEG